MNDDVLDDIDADIAAACAHRSMTWRKLVTRDDQINRDAFDAASAHVDDLLDMRNDMLRAERMVTP